MKTIDLSLSKEELKEYAKNHLAFHGLDLSRVSTLFIDQIHRSEINRDINIFGITDEVKHLEGLRGMSATGEEKPFRGKVLKGLHKKHFMDASFILKNIGIYMGYEQKESPRLNNLIKEAFEKCTTIEELAGYIAHHSTIGAYQERSKKNLTGEWIIFKKYHGKNYYLTIATHNEADETIYERVKAVYELDFPFLLED